ncbi:UNVERIFIED_CONTAM: hypothetical protein Sindi_2671900 [Sesamum indicum]
MVQSMMSLTELSPSFWGHALETTAKLLNVAPSKMVPQTLYKIWHGKHASYKYLGVQGSPAYIHKLVRDKLNLRSSLYRFVGCPKEIAGYYFYDPSEQKVFISRNTVFLEKEFPLDSRYDEVLLEEISEAPQQNDATSFEPIVSTDSVPVLHRSTRESWPLDRYRFMGLISQLQNDSRTYEEAMLDIYLIDPPKDVKPIGCKWVYKRKLGAEGEVTTFNAMLVAKGYTQRPGVENEETYSPVAMAKSNRILLARATWYERDGTWT